jgi:AbrB family looped-hinge helix DNA binding protein
MQTTLSSKGQVVLPGQIRRKLGLRSGDNLEIRIKNGEIILTPSTPTHKPKASIVVDPETGFKAISFGADAPTLTSQEVEEILANFP